MNLEYEDIKTPEELLGWMSQINYGYQGKTKLHYWDEEDFNEVWFDEYILEEPNDLIKTKVGNCWDQTEFEREWFIKNNYKIKTIYEMVNLPYENPYPTHSFLIYQDKDGSWNWFENSDYDNRGIHKKKTLSELMDYQLARYITFLHTFNIKDEELNNIVIKEYEKPKLHCSAEEYIDHVLNSKDYKGE